MIRLTKPNQEIIYLNPFVIESLEKRNFTVVTITNGRKYMVTETIPTISTKIFEWWEGVFKIKNRLAFVQKMDHNEATN